MVDDLKKFLNDIKDLRTRVKAEKANQIAKKDIRSSAESLGEKWFNEFLPQVSQQPTVPAELIDSYSTKFRRLITISAPSNLKSSYVSVLNQIIKDFRKDFILSLQGGAKSFSSLYLLNQILEEISDQEESEYLKESISCAQNGFFRAAIVMGWCATIDRIHRTIEKQGFGKFNVTSAQMASQQKGRFKKFNANQNVNSIGELREVFDTIILWIIEGMGYIDSNQHTRLRSCFTLRCHCAHPGEAPVTDYNLMSYFSDINEIVFKNKNFKI
ncbi:MAG: hypothetical protein H6756_03510 [Candidatus Omnitrophica bacterium]|nr:hypothetical protein [Candidatus Omnitrophota bacterium]MCB9719919.1 hypothetical protein [Candidatus Omnitrophota bacterium]